MRTRCCRRLEVLCGRCARVLTGLGDGISSAVMLARCKALNQDVAIKTRVADEKVEDIMVQHAHSEHV